MANHVLHIQGMTCEHCVQTVTAGLKAVPGVKDAKVNLAGQSAQVEHEDSTGIGALLAAVQKSGFQVTGFQKA